MERSLSTASRRAYLNAVLKFWLWCGHGSSFGYLVDSDSDVVKSQVSRAIPSRAVGPWHSKKNNVQTFEPS